MINYNNKYFRPVSNTENGETSAETIFKYQQTGNILTSAYAGGRIIYGHLIGLADENGQIEMRYHQVNDKGELMTGICNSRPEQLANGKIRLYETWKWTSGDQSEGKSIIEEIDFSKIDRAEIS
ncbi:hypothetical protein GCM10022289_04840 [Pedobacter jeongneungensis]|uniref:N-acetylglutamate synthase n=1 Tax=Pedobacter jeongneungensis TaxID=947309 RepID=A0ABP8B4J9_9SPHI